jgi:hypothetical protein
MASPEKAGTPCPAVSDKMFDADQLLTQFKRDKYWWSARLLFRFWGGTAIDTYIERDDEEQPTEYQLIVLRALVDHSVDVRPYFAEMLFTHYQENIFNSMSHWSSERGFFGAEEITPPLKTASEIWQLISVPNLYIPPPHECKSEDSMEFKLGFECHWDPEHGLGAQFRDWKIVKFGGSAD